ncbi:hypothetical protein HBB16_13355 [Pseudonocardia sp. MCCB 268]|nr:hypothetical protein [Pseudonocardia cytotoxica]
MVEAFGRATPHRSSEREDPPRRGRPASLITPCHAKVGPSRVCAGRRISGRSPDDHRFDHLSASARNASRNSSPARTPAGRQDDVVVPPRPRCVASAGCCGRRTIHQRFDLDGVTRRTRCWP